MRAVFVDANDTLAAITEKLRRAGDPPLAIHRDPDVKPDELPVVLGDAEIAIIDHTSMPTPLAAQCRGLKHVVFLIEVEFSRCFAARQKSQSSI